MKTSINYISNQTANHKIDFSIFRLRHTHKKSYSFFFVDYMTKGRDGACVWLHHISCYSLSSLLLSLLCHCCCCRCYAAVITAMAAAAAAVVLLRWRSCHIISLLFFSHPVVIVAALPWRLLVAALPWHCLCCSAVRTVGYVPFVVVAVPLLLLSLLCHCCCCRCCAAVTRDHSNGSSCCHLPSFLLSPCFFVAALWQLLVSALPWHCLCCSAVATAGVVVVAALLRRPSNHTFNVLKKRKLVPSLDLRIQSRIITVEPHF